MPRPSRISLVVRALGVGIALMSTACAPTVSTPPAAAESVWAFGDSNGLLLPAAGPGWADLIGDETYNDSRSALGYANLATATIPGAGTERGDAARWFEWTWAARVGSAPLHVVVSLGFNDLIGGRTVTQTEDGFRRLLLAIQSANRELLEAGAPPMDVWVLPIVPLTGTAAIHAPLQPGRVTFNAWLATQPTAGLVEGVGAPVVRYADCNSVIADPARPGYLDARYRLPFDDNHFNAEGRILYARCIANAFGAPLLAP